MSYFTQLGEIIS